MTKTEFNSFSVSQPTCGPWNYRKKNRDRTRICI